MSRLYNSIGDGYDQTRKADPYLVERLKFFLGPVKKIKVIDIGCGTGNYTQSLHQAGFNIVGVDVSAQMLDKAQQKQSEIEWVEATVHHLPFKNAAFDAGLATLTIHHWPDLASSFKEVGRVIRDGHLVIFTALPSQMQGYWLNRYFPNMMKQSINQMPDMNHLEQAIGEAGLIVAATENYFVQPDLQDRFLYSGKFDGTFYLKGHNRAGISSFKLYCPEQELRDGLALLRKDISTGVFKEVQEHYKNDNGDYLFIKLRAFK